LVLVRNTNTPSKREFSDAENCRQVSRKLLDDQVETLVSDPRTLKRYCRDRPPPEGWHVTLWVPFDDAQRLRIRP
jgi:hypothetical protein